MSVHQAMIGTLPKTVFLRAGAIVHGGSGDDYLSPAFINEQFNGGVNTFGITGPNLGLSFTNNLPYAYPAGDPTPHPYPAGYTGELGSWASCYDRQQAIRKNTDSYMEVVKASGFSGSFTLAFIGVDAPAAPSEVTIFAATGAVLANQVLNDDTGQFSPRVERIAFTGIATRVRVASVAGLLHVESMLFGEGMHGQGTYSQLPAALENFSGTMDIGFNSDGSIHTTDPTATWVGAAGRIPNWYTHVLAGVGSAYWVRATLIAGLSPAAGALNTWINVGTEPRWTLDATCTLRFEFATDAGGANIVCTTKTTVTAGVGNSDWRFVKT